MKKIITILALIISMSLTVSANEPAEKVKIGTNVGERAPNIADFGPDRRTKYTLEDLEGKIVLIDFWASWCGPCRRENPNVVNAYNKFKDAKFKDGDGFTVFGVSLDKSRQPWANAIAKDNLDWPYHVSDLKGWDSKHAMVYGIRSIPQNILIDGNGIIIAKNLKGEDLHKFLAKIKK